MHVLLTVDPGLVVGEGTLEPRAAAPALRDPGLE